MTTITLPNSRLLPALAAVQSVVEKRVTIPVLGHFRLRATPGGLTITGTDLELECEAAIEADIDGPASVTTVPASLLHDIARKLPAEAKTRITWGDTPGTARVESGRSRFSLSTLPPEDFPEPRRGEEFPHRFSLPARAFDTLFGKVSFAISTEATRYYLNGVHLHRDGDALKAVATDGHRLALDHLPAPDGSEGMPAIILPRKAVDVVLKLAKSNAGPVAVSLSESLARFEFERITLTTKLIDGTFPDYARVIPKSPFARMRAPREALAKALDLVSTLASANGRGVRFSLGDGALTLAVSNQDAGSAIEEMAVEYAGPPIETGFNSRYMLDALGQFAGDTVDFHLTDNGSPARIESAGESLLVVLMPMRA